MAPNRSGFHRPHCHVTTYPPRLPLSFTGNVQEELLLYYPLTTLVVHYRDQERFSSACSCDILQICRSTRLQFHF